MTSATLSPCRTTHKPAGRFIEDFESSITPADVKARIGGEYAAGEDLVSVTSRSPQYDWRICDPIDLSDCQLVLISNVLEVPIENLIRQDRANRTASMSIDRLERP